MTPDERSVVRSEAHDAALDGEADARAGDDPGGEPGPVRAGEPGDGEGDVGRDERHRALREVDDARRTPDEDERQREQCEDRAAREAGGEQEDEAVHQNPR